MVIIVPQKNGEPESSCFGGSGIVMEVTAGEVVYHNGAELHRDGVLLSWDQLSEEHQAEFQAIRRELGEVADRPKVLFGKVPAGQVG